MSDGPYKSYGDMIEFPDGSTLTEWDLDTIVERFNAQHRQIEELNAVIERLREGQAEMLQNCRNILNDEQYFYVVHGSHPDSK